VDVTTGAGLERALAGVAPHQGRMGRALRAGGLTTDTADVVGSTTFAEWTASA
jgi:hypothetical protein